MAKCYVSYCLASKGHATFVLMEKQGFGRISPTLIVEIVLKRKLPMSGIMNVTEGLDAETVLLRVYWLSIAEYAQKATVFRHLRYCLSC